jgi:hypothetical protein
MPTPEYNFASEAAAYNSSCYTGTSETETAGSRNRKKKPVETSKTPCCLPALYSIGRAEANIIIIWLGWAYLAKTARKPQRTARRG